MITYARVIVVKNSAVCENRTNEDIAYQPLQEDLSCFKNGCEITIRISLEPYGVFHEYLAAIATSVEVFALGDGKGRNRAPVWGLRKLASHRAESLADACLLSLQRGLARTGFYLRIALRFLE
jgi:hypothetical protein